MEGHSNGNSHANDWRSQLDPGLRKTVLLAIVEKLKICFPTHINGINKTAVAFENKVYGVAKNKDDYLRKISEKVVALTTKYITGPSANGAHTPNPAAQSLNQGQSLPTSLTYAQTPTSQQWLPQSNIHRKLNIPDSSGLPPITVSTAQSLNIQMGEGFESNLGPGPQRQIQGSQQLLQQPQQQQRSSNTMYQHQMDPKLLKEKVHQQSLLGQQQLPHHTSLSPVNQSFPHSSAIPSRPISSGQQNSQFLQRHQIPTQRVHPSHQQQMAVPSHLTSSQNNGEQQRTSQQNNMARFNKKGQEVEQPQPMVLQQYQPNNPVQHQSQTRILQKRLDDPQRVQASGSLHQRQNQPYQLQTAQPTNPSTFQDSTSKTLNTSGGDWREETYQKIKALREKYIPYLNTVFQRLSNKLKEIDYLPQHKMVPYDLVKKIRAGIASLEQVFGFLNMSRSNVLEKHRDHFSQYEAHVLKFINPSQRAKQQQQQQQVHLPPSQINQTALQSLDSDQKNSRLMESHQNGHLSSVPSLKTSQIRPKVEPKDDNNIMSSSGDVVVHSLEQKPKLIHSNISPAHQQRQQLQIPKIERNGMCQRVNSTADLLQQHVSTSQPKPLASQDLSQSTSSSHLVEQQTLPTPAQEHPPLVALSPEPITERPIDRLIKAIQASSPESLAESVSEMSRAISMTDRLPGSVHTIGESGARLEDLSERIRYRLQQQEDTNPSKRFKRSVTATPLDSYNTEPSYALLQEINEINGRLVETVVNICNEDVCPSEVTSGTVVMCSYVPVALSATFKALYNSGHVSQIQPLRLLVPESYPCSPIILDKTLFDTASVHKYEDLSARTRSRFGLSMRRYSEAVTLKEIAKVWDECARATMAEYAERHGGGTFSSRYGRWESLLRAS